MNFWLTITVSCVSDFIISAGGAITAAMVGTGSTAMPSKAVALVACITGAIAAARRVQALLQVPPANGPTKP